MTLAPTIQKYILHWGEMGTRWGVNRTVAQIHALLFLVNRPLHAEEIAETLTVARSNVSNSLKELQSWGLVRVTHLAPALQFLEAVAHVGAGHGKGLGDFLGMQRAVDQEQQRVDLRHRAVDAPAGAHLAPVQDVFLDGWCEGHAASFL